MTTKEVSKLSGVSVRTLHHYDNIGILSPSRNPENHYREYSHTDIDTLQQILFFRECGFTLAEIEPLIKDPSINKERLYEIQEEYLIKEKNRIVNMLDTLRRSIRALKGEIVMTTEEKFKAFKKESVDENERKYGEEIRNLYSDTTIDGSNQQLLDMSKSEYEDQAHMAKEILEILGKGLKNPENQDTAKEVALLHQKWLKLMWSDAVDYTKEAHISLIDTYMGDTRFIDYYGGTQAIVYLKLAVAKYI